MTRSEKRRALEIRLEELLIESGRYCMLTDFGDALGWGERYCVAIKMTSVNGNQFAHFYWFGSAEVFAGVEKYLEECAQDT